MHGSSVFFFDIFLPNKKECDISFILVTSLCSHSLITLCAELLPSNETALDIVHYLGAFSKRTQNMIVNLVNSVCLRKSGRLLLDGFCEILYFGISLRFVGTFRFLLNPDKNNTHFI